MQYYQTLDGGKAIVHTVDSTVYNWCYNEMFLSQSENFFSALILIRIYILYLIV